MDDRLPGTEGLAVHSLDPAIVLTMGRGRAQSIISPICEGNQGGKSLQNQKFRICYECVNKLLMLQRLGAFGLKGTMAAATLDFECEELSGVQLIHVSGPLDSATYDEFKNYMDPRIGQSNVRIVLNCQNLTYVNSRGLTLLMHYQRTAKLSFSFFGIAALRQRTLKGIELLGMDKFLTWYPTIEDALQTAAAI